VHRHAVFGLRHLSVALVTPVLFSIAMPALATDSPAAKLDRSTVPARGKQSANLTVSAFGRYGITVSSTQGVALQVVDRMAGAGVVVGEAGKQDGRLDLFLDRGEHKIVAIASQRGSGSAVLSAKPFRELHERPSLLVEHRRERSSLGDFEQRSYWLEIKNKRTVALEAAGRYLADMRLWRDGTWLVDAKPQMLQTQARPEQPLAVARLAVDLEPGLYLLTAYGGASQPWTEASTGKPFLLRYGISTLAPVMRQQFTMSEFGVERFVVPGGPNYFRMELPSAHGASFQVGRYEAQDPFRAQGGSASIDKRALPPVAELNDSDSQSRLVTVTMEAGRSFVLQHFETSSVYRFSGAGDYWISSVHGGYSEDSVGATAVLTKQPRYGKQEYVAEQVIHLAGDAPWHRRFNLLGELTLFVKLSAPTKVRIMGEGVAARYRFEPFLTSRPLDYQIPPWRPGGHVFELDRGLHVLSADPESKGILDLHLLPDGAKPGSTLTSVKATATFPSMHLDGHTDYVLFLNRQPGVPSGVALRQLPIDLTFPLPVTQQPGETLTIPVSIPERGTLRAIAEDGRALEIALNNGKKGSSLEVEPGKYHATVQSGGAALGYSLGLEPARLASQTPLPALPDSRLAGLPKFPVMAPEAPHFLDLKRRSSETYQVRVDRPGLYQFESTGLLHTGGKVRTRVNPSLFEADQNGVGRNFQIQRYLREGDYQLTVSTRGETQGHLGVQLMRTDVIDGGELRHGEVARASLPAGQALAYRFRISARGNYRLQALGLGRNFELRLEDRQGWPVAAPISQGDITLELEPGSYRVVVQPQTAEARVLTRLDRATPPTRYKGHGPHRIALESAIEHTWREPVKGAPRQPDQWIFDLPAPAQVTVALDNEMEGTLTGATDANRIVARVVARQNWRGDLPAGRYMLRAQPSRNNNYVPYTVRVSAAQLMAGQSRLVSAPAMVPLSVGADGLIELQSFGTSDVRARLVDAAGEVLAQNDDRPGDWNFHVALRLRPGEYRLLVDPVSEKRAETTVSMHAPSEVAEKPLTLGSDAEIRDAQVHVYPLTVPADRNVLLVSARSDDAVGLALEGESSQGWVSLGTEVGKAPYLALPLGTDRFKSYRLRAWSADKRSLRLSLRAVAATLAVATESQWVQGGLAPVRIDEKRPELKAAVVALSRPGVFRVKGDLARLQWSDTGVRTALKGSSPVVAVSGRTLWLVSEGGTADLAAERLRLPTGEQEPMRLELMAGQVARVDLQPHAQGPSLVLVQARAAQPGVAVGDAGEGTAMGLVAGEAVAVALPGTVLPARVWNAGGGTTPLELDVRQVALQQAGGKNLDFGIADGSLKSRGALPLKLPGGALRVRLALSPQSAAVFTKGGSIRSIHWAGEEALQETVAATADQLWLLNARPADAFYSVEVAPGGDGETALKPGELLERNVSAVGRLRIPVDVPKAEGGAYRLRVRGSAQALWQENGGRVESGDDIMVRGSGVLWLQHQPGTLVAWLDEPPAQGAERVGRWLKSLQETAVKPPQTVNLKGKQQVLSMDLDRAAMLHLRTTVPVVTQYLVPGRPAQTEAHLHGANINLLAPAGSSRLVLRAVGADSLSGAATVLMTPVIPLADGPGPEMLLAPGGGRLFSFDLRQPATVGIGVRASSDVVRGVLYNERGALQSQGVVQMPALVAGRYYLSVEVPAASAPVKVQPIVLGLNEPDTRPPYDILRRYVQAKEGGDALLYETPPPAPPPTAAGQDSETPPEEGATPPEEGEGGGEETGSEQDQQE
jgi:hypothetical protein